MGRGGLYICGNIPHNISNTDDTCELRALPVSTSAKCMVFYVLLCESLKFHTYGHVLGDTALVTVSLQHFYCSYSPLPTVEAY